VNVAAFRSDSLDSTVEVSSKYSSFSLTRSWNVKKTFSGRFLIVGIILVNLLARVVML